MCNGNATQGMSAFRDTIVDSRWCYFLSTGGGKISNVVHVIHDSCIVCYYYSAGKID